MSRTSKVLLVVLAIVVAASALLVLVVAGVHPELAHAATPQVIPGPDTSPPTKHYCRNHPRRCKRSVRNAYAYVGGTTGAAATSSAVCATCEHEGYSGGGGIPSRHGCRHRDLIVNWIGSPIHFRILRQRLSVRWCWSHGRTITDHSRSQDVTDVWWALKHDETEDQKPSEWYWWQNKPIRHHGRYEGFHAQLHECTFLFGFVCDIGFTTRLHYHLHSDGTWTYSASKV